MAGTLIIEYLVRPDSTIVAVRGAWDAFASENGAPELTARSVVGRSLGGFMGDPETRLIYEALLGRVAETAASVRFPFRCDGPGRRRHMEMEVGQADPELIRFRSRLVREEERPVQLLLDSTVDRSEELVVMCSWCKSVRGEDDLWLEVEEYVESSGLMEASVLPRLTHGVCPDCERDMNAVIEASG